MGKVICLGLEFNSDEERREHFRSELRSKLPELKKIEGFPIGEDDDIITLSDPPYYTACPNPWLNDFIAEWENEKKSIVGWNRNHRVVEPYANDISEGKNNPIYNAHSYHTKVPHPAIMRYILHYTQPGDIVFDGFGGTGMTAVACNYCDHPESSTRFQIDKEFKESGAKSPKWGIRKSIVSDLSPVATFISANYNTPVDNRFDFTSESIINIAKKKFSWMYETHHNDNKLGTINSTIWSEVFTCPHCNSEIVFWDVAVNLGIGTVSDNFRCSSCDATHTKSSVERCFETVYDPTSQMSRRVSKFVPVLINYRYLERNYDKRPDEHDLRILDKIKDEKLQLKYNSIPIIDGDEINRLKNNGFSYLEDLFFDRSFILLDHLFKLAEQQDSHNFKLYLTSIIQRASKLFRWSSNQAGPLMGTYYIASSIFEISIFNLLKNKNKLISSISGITRSKNTIVYCGSSTEVAFAQPNSIDYIFTDPPFGSNLMYSELNYIWESWLRVSTNNKLEAIENKTQNKSTFHYQDLMTSSFKENYRVLKPGKWMTVEFSNTSAAVWNGIQNAIQKAGFIIANVTALDKKQGSFKAVTTATAVKQDLVISCYKPSTDFENRFNSVSSDVATWEFLAQHLNHLPTHLSNDQNTTAIIERSPKILYDRLITFYLMRGLPIPIDAKEFQDGLIQRFVERDGMYFTKEQVFSYDEKKALSRQFIQLSLIVTSESDAIEWLKDRLRNKAEKYQDIMPEFRMATQSLRRGDTLPELQDILNENFIKESDGSWRTPKPNEAVDREALRTKALLKEFNGYVAEINQPRAKKLKEVRVEALRAGFKQSWDLKEFKTIVTMGDMIPQNILLEDEQLLMYYDIAKDRV